MSHLTLETLARLVDEPPTPAEAAHLESCAACRRELEELVAQTAALADLPDLAPPPEAWPALEQRLRREGLIRGRVTAVPAGGWLPRLAAAIVVFLVGGVVGFAARGRIETLRIAGPAAAGATVTAAFGEAGDPVEAARHLVEAEAAYRAAFERYVALTGEEVGADPIARLAALDHIVRTTRAALREAPADPVLNGYHLTALAQREATVRQLVAASAKPWY